MLENYAVVAISGQQPRNLTAVVAKVAEHIMFFMSLFTKPSVSFSGDFLIIIVRL